jgi:putative ABC transport system permease protein
MIFHIKLAIRNILKQKTGSLINVFGLSVSLAACLIIVLFVQQELNFDRFNKNYNSIYRLLTIDKDGRSSDHPVVFNKVLEENIPELKNGTMLFYYNKATDFFRYNNNDFITRNVVFTTQSFFNIFSVEFLKGNRKNALDAPNKTIITESTAKKIFGSIDPVGKIIRYSNNYDFEVTGVIKDLPKASHFQVDLLVSIESQKNINSYMMESWNNSSTSFYYLLPQNIDIRTLGTKITEIRKKAHPEDSAEITYELQPLSKIHLYSSDTIWDSAIKGDIQVVIAFILIAILILIIACFNFINLSIALSGKRNFYSGIQKSMGAGNKTIFISTFTESLLLVLFCAICSVYISLFFIPGFNRIMGTSLNFSFSNPIIFSALVILIAFTVILSSLFQSWRQAHINPVDLLSGKGRILFAGKNRLFSGFSRSLSIVQLVISISLVVGVITIFKQTSLLLDGKLGFNKSQLIVIKNPWDKKVNIRYRLIKEQLKGLSGVKGVSASWNVPGEYINNYSGVELIGNDKTSRINFGQLPIDADFLDVLEAKLLFGRNFNTSLSSDSNKVIINKMGMNNLQLDKPIGKHISNYFTGPEKSFEIIGVIDDIQYQTLKEKGKPAIYYLSRFGLNKIIVRLNPGNMPQIIKKIEKIWNATETEYPFEYEFIDQRIQANYEKEIRTKTVLSIMTFLAISISMLGIFGLVVFITQNRIKEIGIRKINGASVLEVMTILSKDFIRWVVIAFIIACPVSWLLMHKWLQNFSYKTDLSWWIFAMSGIIMLGIVLLTVSWQSWRAAIRNPVEALRYE